jgi:hypothetical protein
MKVIVDSSVWSLALRRDKQGSNPARFPPRRDYLLRWRVYAGHQRALPLLHSSYGLMRQTKTLLLPRI